MTSALAYAATLLCACACVVLVMMEARLARPGVAARFPDVHRDLSRVKIVSKSVAAASFVAVGWPALAHGTYGRWMFAGLVFGAIGDVCLLGHSTRAFLAGLLAFLAGHLAYVVGFGHIVPPDGWPRLAGPLAAIPLAMGIAVVAYLWPRLGTMRGPVLAYVLTIVTMVVGALAIRPWAPHGTMLAIGAALFFASDLAVARERFVVRDVRNKLWGLPAYFAGQLLIAWAVR